MGRYWQWYRYLGGAIEGLWSVGDKDGGLLRVFKVQRCVRCVVKKCLMRGIGGVKGAVWMVFGNVLTLVCGIGFGIGMAIS